MASMTKAFFYDSVEMPTKMGEFDNKGCLLTNTYNELQTTKTINSNSMTEFMVILKGFYSKNHL
jgi:hypothetical protein